MLTIDAAVWARGRADGEKPLIVALHGYGSHEHDLATLAPLLPTEFDVVSLRAPMLQPDGPGYAWFPLSGPKGIDPDAINAGAAAVEQWFADTVTGDRTIVPFGFSQGGATAVQLLRRNHDRFPGVVALSSLLSPRPEAGDAALAEAPKPVFWGHADRDDIISMFDRQLTPDWLHDHTLLTEKVYPGIQHSISVEEMLDVSTWLKDLIARS